jgi:hypothetical protein
MTPIPLGDPPIALDDGATVPLLTPGGTPYTGLSMRGTVTRGAGCVLLVVEHTPDGHRTVRDINPATGASDGDPWWAVDIERVRRDVAAAAGS